MNLDALIVSAADWGQDAELLSELRKVVFVGEQNVPTELEIDGKDPICLHVKALHNGLLVGTGRLLPDGTIGRMCVAIDYRGFNIGKLLLENLVNQARSAGHSRVFLNSQSYAIAFYEKSGFVVDSEEFMEAVIPHKRMILDT